MDLIDSLLGTLPKTDKFLFIWTIEQGVVFIGYFNLVLFLIPSIFDIIWVIGATMSGTLGTLLFQFIVNVSFVMLSVFLIIAVKKENAGQIFTWLTISLFLVILSIVAFIFSIIISFVGALSMGIVFTIWYFYCILVVNSYYKEMDGGPINY